MQPTRPHPLVHLRPRARVRYHTRDGLYALTVVTPDHQHDLTYRGPVRAAASPA